MRPWLTSLCLLACCAIQAQTLQQDLQAIAAQRGIVGMSVVATCNGTVTQVVHSGVRNLAMGLPVNDGTRYRVASISKLVTALGMMKLHESGAFELDDDVSTALGFTLRNPAFPATPITYRMLLSHRSSLQDGTGYNNFLNATYATAPPPAVQQLVVPGGTWYTTNLWRTELPGTHFAYSNLNFGLIGTLIEAHSGMRFDQFMRQWVLDPMGINGSFNVQDLDSLGNLSVLYRNSGPQADNFNGVMPTAPDLSGYVPGSNGLYFAPQGGLRATALEMAQVLKLIHGEGTVDGVTLLQPSTMQLMAANEWTWNGSNGDNYYGLFRSWGLGVHRVTAQAGGDLVFPGTFMLGHAGEAYGLISDLYYDPATGFGLVFISNGYTPGNSYALGVNSAFYRVEEEVFGALNVHAVPACISTGTAERETYDLLGSQGRAAHWTGVGPLHLQCTDNAGRLLEEAVLFPNVPWMPRSTGPLLLVGVDGRGRRHLLRLP